MTEFREAVLEATLQAANLHRTLSSESNQTSRDSGVDIFRIIQQNNIFLFFKKLEGLLGAYLPIATDPGILITTERSLAIQRFTAAHELGHAILRHGLGIDDEGILKRSPFGKQTYDAKEMGADTFASMFLMPDWLISAIAARHGWSHTSITQPDNVYQMSLRLGVSYEALVRTLQRHGMLNSTEGNLLLKMPVKQIKQRLLSLETSKPLPISNWRSNVWLLTEADQAIKVVGEPDDLFIVRLREKSTAGYLWNMEQVRDAGFNVVADRREAALDDVVGQDVTRILTAHISEPVSGALSLPQARPWNPADTVATFSFSYDFKGREVGVSRFFRETQVAA
jgi:Zn-dependent peptidase ImmA (M78 family)